MKIVRVVLLTIFLVSIVFLSGGSKDAVAAKIVTSYIPLVSDQDQSDKPFEVMAQREFESLMPALLKAQNQGKIEGFNLELKYGIVAVTHPAFRDLAKILDRPVFSDARSAVSSRVIEARVEQRIVSEGKAGTPTFYMNLYSTCFDGWNLPANTKVRATIRNTSGVIVGLIETMTYSTGYVWDCFYSKPDGRLYPGYKVTFRVLSVPAVTYAAYGPNLQIKAVNKTLSQVTFQAQAGKSFYAYWYQPDLNASGTYSDAYASGTVPTGGAVTVDYSTSSMRGGAYYDFTQQVNANFQAGIYSWVSSLYCAIGANYCYLYGIPFTNATISIVKSGVTYNFTGKFSPWGSFYAGLTRSDGFTPLPLTAGDVVKGTGVANLTIPNFTANPFPASNKVMGYAPETYKYLDVILQRYSSGGSYYYYCWSWVKSDGVRFYTADYTGWCEFTGSMVSAYSYYTYPTTGHEVRSPYYNIGP